MKTRKWVEIKTRRVIERPEKVKMNEKLWALIPEPVESATIEFSTTPYEEEVEQKIQEEQVEKQEFKSLYFLKKDADNEHSAWVDGKEYIYSEGSWRVVKNG